MDDKQVNNTNEPVDNSEVVKIENNPQEKVEIVVENNNPQENENNNTINNVQENLDIPAENSKTQDQSTSQSSEIIKAVEVPNQQVEPIPVQQVSYNHPKESNTSTIVLILIPIITIIIIGTVYFFINNGNKETKTVDNSINNTSIDNSKTKKKNKTKSNMIDYLTKAGYQQASSDSNEYIYSTYGTVSNEICNIIYVFSFKDQTYSTMAICQGQEHYDYGMTYNWNSDITSLFMGLYNVSISDYTAYITITYKQDEVQYCTNKNTCKKYKTCPDKTCEEYKKTLDKLKTLFFNMLEEADVTLSDLKELKNSYY